MGFYPVTEQPYDQAYWERYRRMDDTPVGAQLTAMRVALVKKYLPPSAKVLDIGIGGGRFVSSRPNTNGFDINPEAITWLLEQDKYVNPYRAKAVSHYTFWDSLEHIHELTPLLDNCSGFIFVSLPIFRDADHVLTSKHYRKDEHCWYFTNKGFVQFMNQMGFAMHECNLMEQDAGREGIGTYVFERKDAE